jgi:hypothetical protein
MTDDTLAILARVDSVEREMRFQSEWFRVIASRLAEVDRLTTAEAASILQVSTDTVLRDFAHERVPHSRRRWIPRESVRAVFVSSKRLNTAEERESRRRA